MDAEALGRCIDAHYHRPGDRLFRLELLPTYAVDSDGDDYRRWLDGAVEPTWARKQPWLDRLRRERADGLRASRVRVLSPSLTDYERYACSFGYAYNAAAGEDIRVLHRGRHPMPTGLVEHDFWLLNDDLVVVMHYDGGGRFAGARVAGADELGAHLRTRELAWAAAEPFDAWWARHREHCGPRVESRA